MERQLIFLYDKKTHEYLDRTREVCDIRQTGGRVLVMFQNGQTYSYGREKVRCYPLLRIRENVKVYLKGVALSRYSRMHDYGEYIRLEDNAQELSQAFRKTDVAIDERRTENPRTLAVLDYFRQTVLQEEVQPQQMADDEQTPEKSLQSSIQGMLSDALNEIDPECSVSALSDYLHARIRTHSVDRTSLVYPFGCNESQRRATEQALSSSLSIVEGPPGTGKTQTILNIVANLLMQGKTVAVVSNNNSAVGNVHEKMTRRGYGKLLAALGKKENRIQFFDEQQTDFRPDGKWLLNDSEQSGTRSLIAACSDSIDELFRKQNELASLCTRLAELRCEYGHVRSEQPVSSKRQEALDRLFKRRLNSDRVFLFRRFATRKLSAGSGFSPAGRIECLFRFGIWRYGKLLRSSGILAEYANHLYYRTSIREIETRIDTLKQWTSVRDAKKLTDRYIRSSEALFRDRLYRTSAHWPDFPFTAENYRSKFRDFTKRYPVILSTTYSLKSSIHRDCLLDYVIIDESSQVDVITAAICSSCCQNLVVIGDSRQLPQIIGEESRKRSEALLEEARIDEAYDYVRHNILTSLKTLYKDRIPTTLLREHYRCDPLIIGFCNRKFYDGQLIVMTRPGDTPPFKVISTNISGERSRHGIGVYNRRQIDATCEWLAQEKTPPSQIGVISPYRYHASELRKSLPDEIEADTIHKFQGREKEVIVFHTVRGHITSFMDNPNLINVAVSRAIRQLVVVKSGAMETPHGSNLGDLLRYIRYTCGDSEETFVESKVRSVFDLLYKEYADQLARYQIRHRQEQGSKAEILLCGLLRQLFSERREFAAIGFAREYALRDLIRDVSKLPDEERAYIRHGAHIDFLLYNRMDNSPILAIEVDGVTYHRFSARQTERDRLKNRIMTAAGLPLLRLSTDGCDEKQRIVGALEAAMLPDSGPDTDRKIPDLLTVQ